MWTLIRVPETCAAMRVRSVRGQWDFCETIVAKHGSFAAISMRERRR